MVCFGTLSKSALFGKVLSQKRSLKKFSLQFERYTAEGLNGPDVGHIVRYSYK